MKHLNSVQPPWLEVGSSCFHISPYRR